MSLWYFMIILACLLNGYFSYQGTAVQRKVVSFRKLLIKVEQNNIERTMYFLGTMSQTENFTCLYVTV